MEKIYVNNYLLDEQQTLPILKNDQYSLIIAGAGSGKTLTLVGKIKYLLSHHLFKKEEICCISFTNEAVFNLQKSIFQNCHEEINCFTFHKLAIYILDMYHIEYDIAPESFLRDIIIDFFASKCYGNQKLQDAFFHKFSFSFFKTDKTWKKILEQTAFKKFVETINLFISLVRANGYGEENFKEWFKKTKNDSILFIYAIYLFYESSKEKNKWIDFDDMILKATFLLQEKGCHLPFKMILIDEFQDTSWVRFSLIQEIVTQNDASLCVVGDDYQSIYHFSGCDLDLFLHFTDYFSGAKVYKLEQTYRNSDELVKIAGRFISKNPRQLPKELLSSKHLSYPIFLVYYTHQKTCLIKILKRIAKESKILILGRNRFDLSFYTKNLLYDELPDHQIRFHKFPEHYIRYLTIHASKGLESDVVILLNVADGTYGIPSKVREEKLLSLVKKGDFFPYEEERRLFYVALTRTKSVIYLLIPKNAPSCFIREIKKEKNVKILHIF